MSRRDTRALECGFMLIATLLALFLVTGLTGCASEAWPHFVDPWPVDAGLHPDQPALCDDFCRI